MIPIVLSKPMMLLGALPLIIVLFWLLFKDFVKVDRRFTDEENFMSRRNKARWALLFTRSVVIILLFIALAVPYTEKHVFAETDPTLTVLVDKSASMEVMNTAFMDDFLETLRDKVPVKVRDIGSTMESRLGDEVLASLREGENLLLITDGNSQGGVRMKEVALFASTINSSINALELEAEDYDVSVSVLGPSKAVDGVNNTYAVVLSRTHEVPTNLVVSIDGEETRYEGFLQDTLAFERSFTKGSHLINARVEGDDYFPENNQYVHTVNVVEKPAVLYVNNKQSGLTKIVDTLYEATHVTSIPESLDEYYAVIINDMNARYLSSSSLLNFVNDGNGVLFVGGENSFDKGGYKNTVLETLLPVKIGTGTRREGSANIVIAIDFSGSTGSVFEEVDGQLVERKSETQALEKALAVSVIEILNPGNYVGVLGFTYPLPGKTTEACTGACPIQPVQQLGKGKDELIDKISRVDIGGNTAIWVGLEGALKMLEGRSGSRNIILITDGVTNQQDRDASMNAARLLAAQGGQLYTVHVGDVESGMAFLQELALNGNGIAFEADRSNRLSVLFGDPVEIDQGDAFDIFSLNQHHFITRDLELSATLYGYNQVVPKPGSQLLVTSNGGDAVLTVWNYGIGRVAAITAFNGPDIGQLLTAQNSKLISRTINWLVRDPDRKKDYVVRIPDGRVGKPVRLNITSDMMPVAEGMTFKPLGGGLYTATVTQEEQGVYVLLGVTYAVNGPAEYSEVGFNEGLEDELSYSGGRVFSPGNIDGLIEHVKTMQQIRRVERQKLVWPFVLVALSVYFVEVLVRRIVANRRRK